MQHGRGRGGLGDDRRVDAYRRAGDRRRDRQRAASDDRADHRPHERALALLVVPRVEVVADPERLEAGRLGGLAPAAPARSGRTPRRTGSIRSSRGARTHATGMQPPAAGYSASRWATCGWGSPAGATRAGAVTSTRAVCAAPRARVRRGAADLRRGQRLVLLAAAAESYRRWRERGARDFVFAVKGGRFITHLKRLRDVETPLANFFASGVLALGAELGPVLWQLPERLAFDEEWSATFFDLLPADDGGGRAGRRGMTTSCRTTGLSPRPSRTAVRHALEFRSPTLRHRGDVRPAAPARRRVRDRGHRRTLAEGRRGDRGPRLRPTARRPRAVRQRVLPARPRRVGGTLPAGPGKAWTSTSTSTTTREGTRRTTPSRC